MTMEVVASLSSLPTLVLLLVLGPLLLYWYLSNRKDYWHDKGVPYVPSLPLVGSALSLFASPMHEVEIDRYKKYGKMYGLHEGNLTLLSVADPDLLKNVLVKDFQYFTSRRDMSLGDKMSDNMVSALQGEAWKRVRTIITPAFTSGKMKRMVSIFTDSAKSLVENFDSYAKSGKSFQAKSLFGTFAMDVIASSAFGMKIDSHKDPQNPFVMNAKTAFFNLIPWRMFLFFISPNLMKFLRISFFRPEAVQFFEDITLKIIEERKKSGKIRNDFLQLLMDSTSEHSGTSNDAPADKVEEADEVIKRDIGHEEENDKIFKSTNRYNSLTHDELIAQCILFFFAGYDTTASTLAFASYELALNPNVQEKLIAEIDASIREHNNKVTYEGIQGMKYLDNVISETVRKYPPAVRSERKADEDYVLGDTGITIKKGMIIAIPIYAIHHDADYYDEPHVFRPERFSPNEKAQRNSYTYLPFGAGPRNCLGMRFALLEMKMCLAYTLSQFRFKRSPQTKVPLEFHSGQGVLQPKDVAIVVELRTDKVLKAL